MGRLRRCAKCRATHVYCGPGVDVDPPSRVGLQAVCWETAACGGGMRAFP